MKKVLSVLYISAACCLPFFAQPSILTASAFFQSVSETYGKIKDYEASVEINAGKTEMAGKVSFKRPDLLRIDFSNPETQVIVFNGELLTIYLPGPKAVLNQTLGSSSSASGAGLATPQGLTLMSRYYSIAYQSGPDPVPLKENSPEKVIRLVLSKRSASEGFRTITLSIDAESKMIRMVEAVANSGELFTFSFSQYSINVNIPDTRFIYDAPSSANNYNNFLFSE